MNNRVAYIEVRGSKKSGSLTSDLARHWQARHTTGKALIISDEHELLSRQLHKQWQRLTSSLQNQRSNTFGADDILNLTTMITRMQQTIIVSGAPNSHPHAHVWCTDTVPAILPSKCLSVYVLRPVSHVENDQLRRTVSAHTLVVDYSGSLHPADFTPKAALSTTVDNLWQELANFFTNHNIHIGALSEPTQQQPALMDDALDTLLGVSGEFLRIAYQFQEALQLAQPLRTDQRQQRLYDIARALSRQVNALSPSHFGRYMSGMRDEDTFSLYDQRTENGSLAAAITRHVKAGRARLAAALENCDAYIATAEYAHPLQ